MQSWSISSHFGIIFISVRSPVAVEKTCEEKFSLCWAFRLDVEKQLGKFSLKWLPHRDGSTCRARSETDGKPRQWIYCTWIVDEVKTQLSDFVVSSGRWSLAESAVEVSERQSEAAQPTRVCSKLLTMELRFYLNSASSDIFQFIRHDAIDRFGAVLSILLIFPWILRFSWWKLRRLIGIYI